MRVTKVDPEDFDRMVRSFGKSCQFVRLPSSKDGYCFTGLVMSNCAWVSWPHNLTEDEMKLYVDKYGSPPDLFDMNFDEKVKIRNVLRETHEDQH